MIVTSNLLIAVATGNGQRTLFLHFFALYDGKFVDVNGKRTRPDKVPRVEIAPIYALAIARFMRQLPLQKYKGAIVGFCDILHHTYYWYLIVVVCSEARKRKVKMEDFQPTSH